MTNTSNRRFRWRPLPPGPATTFSNLSTATGYVTGVPLESLPPGHQKMKFLLGAHWSGYCDPIFATGGITGVGELVLIRHDESKSKAYVYAVGASGDASFISPEFKHFDGHHSPINDPASFNSLFGNISWAMTPTSEPANA